MLLLYKLKKATKITFLTFKNISCYYYINNFLCFQLIIDYLKTSHVTIISTAGVDKASTLFNLKTSHVTIICSKISTRN